MSIQPVLTHQRVSETPAPRRRAEGGEGEAFALPERPDPGAEAANKGADAKPAEEASAETPGAEAVTKPAAGEGKGEGVVKPGNVVAKSPTTQPADSRSDAAVSGTGIDFLIAMAAAQAEAAAAPDGEGKTKLDGKPASGEGDQPAGETKAGGDAAGAVGPQPSVDQTNTGVEAPHSVPVPMLPLPVVATGGDGAGASQSPDASTIVAGGRAKPQGMSLPLPGFAKPDAHSAGTGETTVADDAKLVDGKTTPVAGQHGSIKGADDTSLAGVAPQADATAAAPAADPKLLDSLQQALGPLDLSAMLQQGAGKPGHDRLVQPFDPGLMPGGAGNAPGQGAAAGQPTPIHVVPIEIGLRAMAGAKQFDIRLDPGELGRVDVNLSISDSGEVSAKLVVDRVETLHLLQRDARTLERAFEQAGLKPSDGGVDISLRDPSDQSAFRQNRQHDEAPQRPRSQQGAERADETNPSSEPAPQRRLVRLGGVDLSI